MSKTENIEALVIGWLNDNLASGWTAYGDKPKTLPTKYVLVERTGGAREAMVLDMAEILIEVYSKNSRLEASNEANTIADIIPSLVSLEDDITHASVNSIIQLDDTETQTWRYQIYLDIYHRR